MTNQERADAENFNPLANEAYRKMVFDAMQRFWGDTTVFRRTPAFRNWIRSMVEQYTGFPMNTQHLRNHNAEWILSNLSSSLLAPPHDKAFADAHLVPLLPIRPTREGLKAVLRASNTRGFAAYTVPIDARVELLKKRVDFLTYRQPESFFLFLMNAIGDPACWSEELRIFVGTRQGAAPAGPPVVDLTSEPRAPPRRPQYTRIDPSDVVFRQPIAELAAALPHIAGDPAPFQKTDELEVIGETSTHRCPISMKPIEVPVRGRNCKHARCFDLATFMRFVQEQQRHWKCPLCPEEVQPTELVISEHAFLTSAAS